mgnify:FL=1
MESLNYYDLLGLSRSATTEQIKKSYRKAALKSHPDKGGDPEKFRQISKAFEILSDPKTRSSYDQSLKQLRSRDGTGPTQESSPPKRKRTSKPPGSNVTEIPSNPETLSVKELKSILESLGIKHSDCFEKSELIERLKKRKKNSKPPRPKKTESSEQILIKILSIGDPECGKSCIIKRYCEGRFVQRYISTIGVDYGVKKLNIQNRKIAVNFFDLSGARDYNEIRKEFYKDSQGVLLVFEVTDKSTFNNLVKWEREARSSGLSLSDVDVVVCGNKTDLGGREVSSSEAGKWATTRGYKYFDTSASNGSGISDALDQLFNSAISRYLSVQSSFSL